MTSVICCFDWDKAAASRLAKRMDAALCPLKLHTFPDGETLVTGPAESFSSVILYCSLVRPNEKLTPLMFAVDALLRTGTDRIILVSPYMPYMRQDQQFSPGQALSQQAFGRFIAALVDRVVTVDAHLHRTKNIEEVFPGIDACNLSSAGTIARYAAEQGIDSSTVLVGPDVESRQWVEQLAKLLGCEFCVGEKARHSDHEVTIRFPEVKLKGHQVLLVDDIVSSGGTMIEAVKSLKAAGATQVVLAVTHALLSKVTEQVLYEVGVSKIWTTDSTSHDLACIELADLLARHLQS